MKKNKKVVLLATALVSSVIIIGATYAWFTAEDTVLNNFNSKNVIGVDLVEDFDSIGAGDLKPGVVINKRVSVVQTGTGAAVTRVRLEEMLQKFEGGNGVLTVYNEVAPNPADASLKAVTISKESRDAKINALGLTEIADRGRILVGAAPAELLIYENQIASVSGTTYQYLGFNKIDEDTYQLVDLTTAVDKITGVTYQFNKKLDAVTAIHLLNDGDTELDPEHGNIILTLNDGTKVKEIGSWTGPEDAWFYDTDGWAYYGKLLGEGVSTPTLLESVELDKKVGNEANDIDYKINVRMQAVQPTWEAIDSEWNAAVTQKVNGNFEIIGPTTLSAKAQEILKEIIAPRN